MKGNPKRNIVDWQTRERKAQLERFEAMSRRQKEYANRIALSEFSKPQNIRFTPTEILNKAEIIDYRPNSKTLMDI